MANSVISVGLSIVALTAIAATPVNAAPPAPKPAAFALTAAGSSGSLLKRGAPGQQLRGAVLVRNLTKRPLTVRLMPAQIRTAVNGNADYVTNKPTGSGRWLRLDERSVRLAPRATRRVAFTVRVPKDAKAASHYAGIVGVNAADLSAKAATGKSKGRSFSFKHINRLALPLTIRLRGPQWRELVLRSLKLDVQPAGAGLVLRLAPGGTALIQDAPVQLRVSRGSRTVFSHKETLGQLFPGSALDYRIPWVGRPTEGSYRVVGTIRPQGADVIQVDETVSFKASKVEELERETAATAPASPSLPTWVFAVLGGAALLLILLAILVWRLSRSRGAPVAA